MAAYHKVEVSLNTNAVEVGIPSPQSVTVTVPTVGPVGPQGPAGPKGDPGEVSGSIAWDNVTDKPSTFTPSSHTHVAADITDFTAAVEAVSPPADWDTLANKPASFTPSAHSSTHHTGGTDALAAHQINGQTIFGTGSATYSTDQTLGAARALQLTVSNTNASGINLTLPAQSDGTLNGDTYVVIGGGTLSGPIVVRRINLLSPLIYQTLATITATGQQYRFRASGGQTGGWTLVPVDTHTHPSTQITGLGTAATQDSTAFAPATGIDPTAITGTAVVDSDARLSDSRTPTSHSSSHASAGSDPLAPSDIGAQSIFVSDSLVLATSAEVTLTAARAKIFNVLNFSGSDVDVVLPQTGNQVGDTFVFRWASGSNQILVRGVSAGSPVISLTDGEQKRVIRGASSWSVIPVDTHAHAASAITSGTLDIARIPTGTSSSTVCIGDDARLSDARTPTSHTHGNITNAGLVGTTANLPLKTGTGGIVEAGVFGTGAGEFAEGNHTHADLHTRSHAITSTSDHTAGNHKVFYSNGSGEIVELALGNSGEVLTSNGATSAPSFAAASGGGFGEVRFDTSGSYTYTGQAAAGASESSAVWFIRRSEFSSAGAYVSTTTANNVEWDDRLTASYT